MRERKSPDLLATVSYQLLVVGCPVHLSSLWAPQSFYPARAWRKACGHVPAESLLWGPGKDGGMALKDVIHLRGGTPEQKRRAGSKYTPTAPKEEMSEL